MVVSFLKKAGGGHVDAGQGKEADAKVETNGSTGDTLGDVPQPRTADAVYVEGPLPQTERGDESVRGSVWRDVGTRSDPATDLTHAIIDAAARNGVDLLAAFRDGPVDPMVSGAQNVSAPQSDEVHSEMRDLMRDDLENDLALLGLGGDPSELTRPE